MPFAPPFRLETAEDVQSYFGGGRRNGAADVLAFARSHAVVKPPILGRIPTRFTVEILDVKRDFRQVVRPADHVVDVKAVTDFVGERRQRLLEMLGASAPPDRAALNAVLVREGRALATAQRRGKKAQCGSVGCDREDRRERWMTGLAHVLDLRDLMGDLMRRWLSTRDRVVGAYLEKAFTLPLLYARASGELDRECVRRLRDLSDRSTLLIGELHALFGARLTGAAEALYRPSVHAFVRAAGRRVLSLEAPPNLRRGVIALIESIRRGESADAVRARLERLSAVHRPRTAAKSLRRIADVVENLLEKLAAFEAFFDVTFARDRLDAYHRAFCREASVEEVSVETVLGRRLLTLYPCKDYHEFLKGHYSRDCTRETSLAGRHLRNPRFFNLRVFLEGRWIGNIYMLDYTAAAGAVILDRIQIASSADLMPADFFPQLMAGLEAAVTGPAGHALYGPAAISNFAPIQQSYLRYRRHLDKVRIRPPCEDQCFEGVRGGILYVLRDARPKEREARVERVPAVETATSNRAPSQPSRQEPSLFPDLPSPG